MAVQFSHVAPEALEEDAIRRGVELLYFGYSHLTRSIDERLADQGLGRAHHRALYFIARQPDLMVGDLLKLLNITKQSLGRVLNDLARRNLVESREGENDRRQRLLRLTPAGAALEATMFEGLREKLSQAYVAGGDAGISGFWAVLEALIPADERDRVFALRDNGAD